MIVIKPHTAFDRRMHLLPQHSLNGQWWITNS